VRRKKGDDQGCFAAALAAVRRWRGVIEHPEGSHAWPAFGLNKPPKSGTWIPADFVGGWTCCVEQGHYGHRARKATWLYAFGVRLVDLRWGRATGKIKIEESTKEARRLRTAAGVKASKRINPRELAQTPIPFRDLLIDIARCAT